MRFSSAKASLRLLPLIVGGGIRFHVRIRDSSATSIVSAWKKIEVAVTEKQRKLRNDEIRVSF